MITFQGVDSGDLKEIANSLERIRVTWPTGLAAIAVVIVGVVASRLAHRYLRRLALRTDAASATTLRLLARLAVIGIMFFAVGAALGILGFEVVPLLAILSVVVVFAAVAFRPLLESFAAGVTLQTRRPFAPGDEVRLVETEGVVREVTARTVYVEAFTGEHVYIPNRNVLGHTITNYTAGDARLSVLEVGLDYDTDLVDAEDVILAAVRDTPDVHSKPEPTVRVHTFGESSVNADIRFWHGSTDAAARNARHEVAGNVKRALEDAGIVLAYPQRMLRWEPDGPGLVQKESPDFHDAEGEQDR